MNCCVLRRRRSATPFGTCWEPPNLILEVKDNGSGISNASLQKSEGFGLRNMRTRASQIDGKLDIHTAAGHGTSIVLTVPIPS
jgi:signal transduction histidine kinase